MIDTAKSSNLTEMELNEVVNELKREPEPRTPENNRLPPQTINHPPISSKDPHDPLDGTKPKYGHLFLPIHCPRCSKRIQVPKGLNGHRQVDAILLQAQNIGAELYCVHCYNLFVYLQSSDDMSETYRKIPEHMQNNA